ncbi:terminase, partial [Stenotrophomonas sp. RS-48]|nr:terminase [Stenotrophomonas sp. RS-48]
MPELTAQQKLVAAELAREDFYFYSRYTFLRKKGFQWMRAKHHAPLCAALDRVFRGECKRLVINLPPRYSKTELAVVNWMSWCLGKVPDSEFIHISYAAPLALNNSANTRELVQHEVYGEIFPEVELRKDSSAKGDWRTTKGGVVYATGAEGTVTGFGAGKARPGFGGAIIIDDPHKPGEADSDT